MRTRQHNATPRRALRTPRTRPRLYSKRFPIKRQRFVTSRVGRAKAAGVALIGSPHPAIA